MSDVRVDKIIVKDFKRIQAIEIDLKPVTALVGGNTSGKSSVLQAAQLCVAMIQASFQRLKKNGDVEYLTTLSNESVSYRPTEYLLNLQHGEAATQRKGFKIGFKCTARDAAGGEVAKSLWLGVVRGKNANLALAYSGDTPLISTLGDPDRPFSIFAPCLSGIPLREEWRTRRDKRHRRPPRGGAVADVLVASGSVLFRGARLHRPRPGEGPLCECPGMVRRPIRGPRHGGYRSPRSLPTHVSTTRRSCSSTSRTPNLHADSQARLYEALRGLAEKTSTRIVFATHSPQLIQLMLDDEKALVVWMDRGGKVELEPEGRPAIPLLMELGALTVGADVFSPANKTILLSEDKDAGPITLFARANGARNFVCLSYNGCSNLGGARLLGRLLCELRPEVRVLIHRDRDFRTPEEMAFEKAVFEKWREQEGADRIVELFTPFNDVEHSFVQPEHLVEALSDDLQKERIGTILADAIKTERDEITARIRAAREVISNNLYKSERMQRKGNLRAQSGILQEAPNVRAFLPANGAPPLEVEQCHGRIVFRALTAALHRELKGDSKAIRGKILKRSEHLRAADWQTFFNAPVEVA